MQRKYLFFGPKKNINNPELTGGIIVLFENLLDYCNKHDIKYDVIDTNKANYKNKLYAYVQILFLSFIKIPKATHVSLHGTANDYLLIAPFALFVSKFSGKHFSLRKFAGNFIEIYEKYSTVKQMILKITLKYSSCNFFETKYLVKYFTKFNPNTFWFPNVRNKSYYHTDQKFRKRFIYLGGITKEKGIDTLCETSNLLANDYTIDLYGILYNEYTKSYFDNYNVKYKGILNVEDITRVLSQYDVLILPSFREGYPGVIIEALSVGLPVISTRLEGILEMLNNSNFSLLVEPGNVNQFKNAIESITEEVYSEKVCASLKLFKQFNAEVQTSLFFKEIEKK